MNIQQVKGAVGDGEEDITAESLSKYEKAAAELGVSLKEVRNGAVSLRNPMIVLDELATAFNKEAEDSIKKANLISAIGGKYRGNQLSALLSNWDTYKDILNTFNADQAAGSAMEEAEKSANNWAGSLNKVKNSWAELVNEFINSENAITVIQSLNKIIQNLTDSAATGSLKTLSDAITSLIKLVGDLTESFGTLPTLLAGVMAFKGESLFGGNINQIVTDFKGISVEIDKYNHSVNRANYSQNLFKKGLENTNVDLRGYLSGLNGAQASVKGYVSSLVTARLKTIALDVATAALNATITFGLSLAISAIVKAFDNWVHAEEKAIESAKELRQSGHDTIMELTKESESFEELQKRYIQLYSSTEDINEIKSELSKIQDELIDKYGKEADGIDLVNGNLSGQIENMRKLKKEQAEAFIFDAKNKKRYEQAKKSLEGTNENARIADSDPTQFFRATVSTNSTTELSNLLRTFSESGVRYDKIVTDMWGKEASIAVMGDLESQVNGWKKLADVYKEIDGYNQDVYDSLMQQYVLAKEKYDIDKADADEFERQSKYYNSFDVPQDVLNSYNSLIDKAAELNSIINGNYSVSEKLKASDDLEDIHHQLNTIAKDYIPLQNDIKTTFASFNDSISNSIQSVGDLREEWFKSLNDIQKGSLKNIDTMKSALQSIMNGENISSDTFWQLAEFDTDHILNGVKMVGDEFQLTEEQIISLKDTYIKKQMESIQLRQTELKQLKSAEEMEARQLQVALDNWKFADKNLNNPKYRAEFEDLQNRLKTAKENVKQYGEQWSLNAILLRQYNASLGNTADLIQAAQSQAEKLSEAFVGRIDKVIDGINDQKDALNEEKEALQDQLDILEEQQKAIEEQIENYKTVAGIVEDEINKQTEALKKQQEAEEEAIQAKIDALKEEREQKEEENELLEKELAIQEKLRDLEKAKNTKVRVYTESGGWTWDVDKDAVMNAQDAVLEAQKAYDEAIDKNNYETQVKALEGQKETISKSYEERIKEYESYTEEWKTILEEQTNAENERLADEILGVEWREKIKDRDVNILNGFRSDFRSYNSQLSTLINGEMANLKRSISAKEDEIKAIDKVLNKWNDYKTQVQDNINALKDQYDAEKNSMADMAYTDNLTLDNMEIKMWDFKEHYTGYLQEVIDKVLECKDAMDSPTDTSWLTDEMNKIRISLEQWQDTLEELKKYNLHINSEADARYHREGSYADGGIISYTGKANVHGKPSSVETAFNAAQGRSLYDMVRTGNFANLVASRALEGINRAANMSTNTNNATTVNVNGTTINLHNVQNPEQFAKQFERYIKTTLTESQVMPRR